MEKESMVDIMFHFLHFSAGDSIRQSKLSKDYAFDAPDGKPGKCDAILSNRTPCLQYDIVAINREREK